MSEKQLNWRTRLETCRASDMSMAAWCRQEDVNVCQIYCWKRMVNCFEFYKSS